MNAPAIPITLGQPISRRVNGKKGHHRHIVPLLDSAGTPLDVFMHVEQYADGTCHKFRIGMDKSSARNHAPDLPVSPIFRTAQVPAYGPAWEWAATQLSQGQLPVARPGHPQDTTVDLLAQHFLDFVSNLEKVGELYGHMDGFSAPFVLARLVRAGWPLTESAAATLTQAITQLDTLPSRLHAPPVSIHEDRVTRAKMAALPDGSQVPCQQFYRTDPHWCKLFEQGEAVPADLRAALVPAAPRKAHP